MVLSWQHWHTAVSTVNLSRKDHHQLWLRHADELQRCFSRSFFISFSSFSTRGCLFNKRQSIERDNKTFQRGNSEALPPLESFQRDSTSFQLRCTRDQETKRVDAPSGARFLLNFVVCVGMLDWELEFRLV